MNQRIFLALLAIISGACQKTTHPTGNQYTGQIDHKGRTYAYELRPSNSKEKDAYQLTIRLLSPLPSKTIYESKATIQGSASANGKLVVAIWRSSLESGTWVVNQESVLETVFDYNQQKVTRQTKGSFEQFRDSPYTEVVTEKVISTKVDAAKAVQYTVKDLIVNYHRLFADQSTGNKQAKVSIERDPIAFPVVISLSQHGENYRVEVGPVDPKNRRHELKIKKVQHYKASDAGASSTLYTSYLIIDDKSPSQWTVRIHYAEQKDKITWQPFPSQFLECVFESDKGSMYFNPSPKLLPYQSKKATKEQSITGNEGKITKEN